MTLFFTIFFFFSIGLLWKRFFSPSENVADYLNQFVIHIAFPAVILSTIPSMEISTDIIIPVISYWGIVLLAWPVSKIISKTLSFSKDIFYTIFILTICGNTAFLGIPLVKSLIGLDAAGYALFYDQLGSFLGVSTIVVSLISYRQSSETTLNIWKLLFKILTFTPFAVLIIALVLPLGSFITSIEQYLVYLGSLVLPITMVVIGLKFSFHLEPKYKNALMVILSLKLLIYPILLWGCLSLLGAQKIAIAATVFQAAAAPMVTAAALLMSARIATPLVTSALGMGTFISFMSLPIWAWLLR